MNSATLNLNPIVGQKFIIAGAYLLPKLGSWLKARPLSSEGNSLLDKTTLLFQKVEGKGINLLGKRKWSFLVNVYGDNLWIALIALAVLTRHDAPMRLDSLAADKLLGTYMRGLITFPAFAYGVRYSTNRWLPSFAQWTADFVKPKE